MNVNEAVATVERIYEGADLDKCMDEIEYLKKELDDIYEEYEEKLKERVVHVQEMGVFWNEYIQEYQIRIGFSNGQSRDVSISNSGPVQTSETLAWCEPKHFTRMNLIAFIVVLARTYDNVYDQDSLANEAYMFLNNERIAPNMTQKQIWHWLCWMPERYFKKADEWIFKKNYE